MLAASFGGELFCRSPWLEVRRTANLAALLPFPLSLRALFQASGSILLSFLHLPSKSVGKTIQNRQIRHGECNAYGLKRSVRWLRLRKIMLGAVGN